MQRCRWLLMSADRLHKDTLVVTQELIANLLGVRRESVSTAAGVLQADGMITYARGRIVINDRPLLEQRSCECYHSVKKEYARLPHQPVGRA